MDFFEAIQILRRRWPIIVLTLVAGLAAGFVTAPGEKVEDLRYAATTTLLINPQSTSGVNLEQAALLATTGAVPDAVAEDLDLADGATARSGVAAAASTETQSMTITATRGEPEVAEAVSSSFAEQLVAALGTSDQQAYDQQVDALNSRIVGLQERIDLLRFAQTSESDESSDPALAAAQQELAAALAELGQLQAQNAPRPPLVVVEEGVAGRVDPAGVSAPEGKPQRAALLGAFGLLLGVGAAFALDRIDTKIRNKRTAETAFGYPVIAEIPPLPHRRDKDELLALTKPSSAFVEAYRGLRTVVALTATPASNGNGDRHGQVILVTSPGAGEGKTTTVAHLAAMLAEVGRSVLVVSADLRRPRLHELFGAEREPGLTEMLSTDGAAPDLSELIRTTPINRVRLLPSGAPTLNPAPLLRQAGEVLLAARRVFDYVIVDTAPVLIANDATELATVADGVVVVARASKTSIDAAGRTAELLDRLGATVLGAVLVEATDTPTAYSYYRYRYYSDDEEKPRRGKWQREKAAATEEDAVGDDFVEAGRPARA